MKPLRDWPVHRLAAITAAWVIGLPTLTAPAVFGAVAWLARAERARPDSAVADSVAPGLRVVYQPDPLELLQSVPRPAVLLLLGLLLFPPLVLWLAWVIERGRLTMRRNT